MGKELKRILIGYFIVLGLLFGSVPGINPLFDRYEKPWEHDYYNMMLPIGWILTLIVFLAWLCICVNVIKIKKIYRNSIWASITMFFAILGAIYYLLNLIVIVGIEFDLIRVFKDIYYSIYRNSLIVEPYRTYEVIIGYIHDLMHIIRLGFGVSFYLMYIDLYKNKTGKCLLVSKKVVIPVCLIITLWQCTALWYSHDLESILMGIYSFIRVMIIVLFGAMYRQINTVSKKDIVQIDKMRTVIVLCIIPIAVFLVDHSLYSHKGIINGLLPAVGWCLFFIIAWKCKNAVIDKKSVTLAMLCSACSSLYNLINCYLISKYNMDKYNYLSGMSKLYRKLFIRYLDLQYPMLDTAVELFMVVTLLLQLVFYMLLVVVLIKNNKYKLTLRTKIVGVILVVYMIASNINNFIYEISYSGGMIIPLLTPFSIWLCIAVKELLCKKKVD